MRIFKIKMYDGDTEPLIAGIKGVIRGIEEREQRRKYEEMIRIKLDDEEEKRGE